MEKLPPRQGVEPNVGRPSVDVAADFFSGPRIHMPTINDLVSRNIVRRTQHPTEPLAILDYSSFSQRRRGRSAQQSIVNGCRGLIIDNEGLVVARPFPAIHDLKDRDELPSSGFTVTDKIDGTLGIMYWLNGEPHLATRRAFQDDRGRIDRMNEVLGRYAAEYPFRQDLTYLWESVDPEDPSTNVVDYGARRDLTLLSVIETATGRELPLPQQEDVPFRVVQPYPGIQTTAELRNAVNQRPNTEGFVIQMNETGERFRIKSDKYNWVIKWRNDAKNGYMPQRVRAQLIQHGTLESLLKKVPAEDHEKVREIAEDLKSQYDEIEYEVVGFPEKYPFVAKPMENGWPYSRPIWEATKVSKYRRPR